jgi:hypothetical protein
MGGGDVIYIMYPEKTKGTRNRVPFVGGDKRDRTADLLNAIQALSQLSYTPTFHIQFSLVEISGIEPLTS